IKQISEPLPGVPGSFIVKHVTENVSGLPEHFHEKIAALFHGFQSTPPSTILHTGLIGGLTLAVLILYPRLLPSAARRVPGPLVGVLTAVLAAGLMKQFAGVTDIATIGSRFNGI